jgi:cobalamin biosynthesis protein CobW
MQILAQLRAADLLVLSKADLVDAGRLEQARAWAREVVGPSTAIVSASFGDLPPELLLGARIGARTDAPPSRDPGHRDADHGHAHPEYETWSWSGEPPLHGHRLVELLKALPDGIVRGKGFLHLREDPDSRYLLQLVGRRWSIEVDRPWGTARRCSRFVLIGLPGSIAAATLDAAITRLAGSPSAVSGSHGARAPEAS